MDHDLTVTAGEITPLAPDKIRVLTPEEEGEIEKNYKPFSAQEAKENPEFCVDGRTSGTPELYAQTLGGAYNIAVTGWLLSDTADFTASTTSTFEALKEKGYNEGVHTDNHGGCGCGFVKRLLDVLNVLKKNDKEIWNRITEAAPALAAHQKTWQEIVGQVLLKDIGSIPEGTTALENAQKKGATLQTLQGDHKEIAAYVNLKDGTTLDVLQNQNTQVFNLDLWYVAQQARDLDMNEDKVKLLTLGLFAATEIVLVESKGKERLPIKVRA
jgi:hypothetical protein